MSERCISVNMNESDVVFENKYVFLNIIYLYHFCIVGCVYKYAYEMFLYLFL